MAMRNVVLFRGQFDIMTSMLKLQRVSYNIGLDVWPLSTTPLMLLSACDMMEKMKAEEFT